MMESIALFDELEEPVVSRTLGMFIVAVNDHQLESQSLVWAANRTYKNGLLPFSVVSAKMLKEIPSWKAMVEPSLVDEIATNDELLLRLQDNYVTLAGNYMSDILSDGEISAIYPEWQRHNA